MNTVELTLPGGFVLEGSRHRTAHLRPLSGQDEAFLCEGTRSLLPAAQTTALLSRCLEGLGLETGENVAEEEDLFGTAVQLAARIAAKAEGEEILVSDTLRGLVAGKGFLFSDRGDVALRGFEDPVRLYEVRWREQG